MNQKSLNLFKVSITEQKMEEKKALVRIDLSGFRLMLARVLWAIVRLSLYRPSPIFMHGWRSALLRLFGAKISGRCFPYPSAVIWGPWNLVMEEGSCLGPRVECYNVAPVTLRKGVTVSQGSYLCTASHDFDSKGFNLIGSEIVLEAEAWIAAEVFIGPGVTVHQGAVAFARSVIVRDVQAGLVVGGNPAKVIRARIFPK